MNDKSYPRVLLLGDSIVEQSSFLRDGYSFGAILAERCNRRFDVVNRGLSGYNTANALVVLQDLIPSRECAKVEYLLILFGANDSCLPGMPSGQHVPLEDFRKNIKTIITHPSVTSHDPTILLCVPFPINDEQLEKAESIGAQSRKDAVTCKYGNAIREIVAETENKKLKLIDLHAAMMKKAAESKEPLGTALSTYLVDGLHLTGAGYKVFAEAVVRHITVPDRVFPGWKQAPRIDGTMGA